MTTEDVSMLCNGIYRIHWLDDTSWSVASVGRNENGDVWFAPANWIGGQLCYNWRMVLRVSLIEASPY